MFASPALPNTPPAGSLFRIAHVRTDLESPIKTDTLDRLRVELSGTASIRAALKANGFSDIVIQSADSYQNLIDALNQGQSDLAFCTSVAYVTQTGEYDVLFQVRRPRDFYSSRGDRVLHRGVVFAGNRSPLFSGNQPADELAAALSRGPVAMVGSFSAAGYVYPSLLLRDTLGLSPDGRPPVFLDSSEEVVKAVLSGTAELGACDASALESVLERNGLASLQMQLFRVVATTDPLPTDPVIIKTRWRPAPPGGPAPAVLGREIREGIRRFFHRQPEMPRLEPATQERYTDVARAMVSLRTPQRSDTTSAAPARSRTPR